jgi:hypothetical protein
MTDATAGIHRGAQERGGVTVEENRMSFAPIFFSPVWFSTDRQLAALTQSWESATMTSKLLGRFEIPADCASLHGAVMPWMRVPLGLQAQGVMGLNEASFSFRQEPYRVFGWRVRTPLEDLSFNLFPNDVSAIEPADFRSPVMRTFDVPFTRVRTSKPSPIDNFLLCVGGRISMPRIRDRSRDLREKLLLWHTVSQQGAMR